MEGVCAKMLQFLLSECGYKILSGLCSISDNAYMVQRFFFWGLYSTAFIIVSPLVLFAAVSAPAAQAKPSPSQTLGADFMPWCEQISAKYRNPKAGCQLACRTKNSGAQRYGPTASQFGAIGKDSNNSTARFASYAQGLGAHTSLLRTYCSRFGKCSLLGVTEKWAPRGHANNNPDAYAKQVGSWIGLPERMVFDPNNINQMAKIVVGMARYELGDFKFTCAEAAQGVNMAFGNTPQVAGPSGIGTLVEGNAAGAQLYQSLFNQNQGFGDPFNINGTNPFATTQSSFVPTSSSSPQTVAQAPQQNQNMPSYLENPAPNAWNSYQELPPRVQTPVVSVSDTGIAEIACKQNTVAWVCNDATSSRGVAKPVDKLFATKGARIGSLYVNPTQVTIYTIQCIKNQKILDSASCTLDPRKRTPVTNNGNLPQLYLEADAEEVQNGSRVTLTWAALKVSSCILEGEGIVTEGVEGSVETDPLYESGPVTYKLVCTGVNGKTTTKSITVNVQ